MWAQITTVLCCIVAVVNTSEPASNSNIADLVFQPVLQHAIPCSPLNKVSVLENMNAVYAPFASKQRQAARSAGYKCTGNQGEERKDGEEWIDGSFKYLCNNGMVTVIACVAGNQTEIAVGDELVIDGFWYKCERTAHGVRYIEEPHCIVDGVKYHIGQEFVHNRHYVMQCARAAIPVIACIVDPGGKNTTIAVGQSVVMGTIEWRCDRVGQGGAQLLNKRIGCMVSGQLRLVDDVWIAGNFKMTCHENGYSPIACVTDNGIELAPGETRIIGYYKHICAKLPNGGLQYRTVYNP